jgi:hypothetical protein
MLQIESEANSYRLHVSGIQEGGNFTDPISSISSSNGLGFSAMRSSDSVDCLERLHMG